MLAKDLKTGTIVNWQDAPVLIQNIMVQTPSARGAATLYKLRARNLITKQKVDISLKGTDNLNVADFAKRPVKFMYSDPDNVYLLDDEDYNQHQLSREDLGDDFYYLTEQLEGMSVMIYNDECVGIQLPTSVELEITECDPYVKGNSATGRTKPAKLETGLMIHVPENINQGQRVKVDTRTGEYLSRA